MNTGQNTPFDQLTNCSAICGYKWAWSTIRLQHKTTNSCHRTDHDQITAETFDSFHNTPIKLKTRNAMLSGKWPGHGCEYCKKIEDAGGVSDRIDSLSHVVDNLVPPELYGNTRAINVSPTMIEVYFSNLCNMSCIYCNSGYSSVWEQEDRVHGIEKIHNLTAVDSIDYKNMVSAFFTWLERNISTLTELNILGGEPFYQPELELMLNFLNNHPTPDLELRVFSNLKVNKVKFNKILNRLQDFINNKTVKSVEIIASIDCWGPQQEYIRSGIDLLQWEENFATLSSNFQNIKIRTHGTITGLTIKTIADLFGKISYYNSFRPNNEIIYSSDLVVNPDCLQPGIFPKGFFDRDFENILSAVSNKSFEAALNSKWLCIDQQEYNPQLILQLKTYLDTLDAKRNTNWRAVFPWLDQLDVDKYHN